ncbi:flavin reductase [Solwaraspora sp. WMMB335]|uniref:flavin reductase n=1 Tax=Solwaraspora sp. WMMB335 TaxID=3404118 RepID=UPI003B95B3E3
MSMHTPVRPHWMCTGCGLPWPCEVRRQELLTEYAGALVSLSVYMATCLIDAMTDLPLRRSGYLYWRFMGWWR